MGVLLTKWQIVEKTQKKIVFQKRSTFREPVDVSEIEAMIPIMSRLLGRLSRRIAAKLASMVE